MNRKEVVLITGASSGIGYETAKELVKEGYIVYAAARRTEKLKELEILNAKIIFLDVTSEQSMKECVDSIIRDEGSVGILINNAGYGSYGAVEDVPLEEARRQLEVNLFGLARMAQLVLPSMREQRYGKIINISSMGGKVHTPMGAWYHATKFALEGFSDCLRMEVKQFGVDVVVIEPGGIRTDWGIIAAENLRKVSKDGPYHQMSDHIADRLHTMYSTGKGLSDPGLIARTIVKAVTSKKPKTRYLTGSMAKPMVFLKRVLSDRLYDRLVLRFM